MFKPVPKTARAAQGPEVSPLQKVRPFAEAGVKIEDGEQRDLFGEYVQRRAAAAGAALSSGRNSKPRLNFLTSPVVQRSLDTIAEDINQWFEAGNIKYIIGGSFSSYKHGSGVQAGDLDIYVQKFGEAVALLKQRGFVATEETLVATTFTYQGEQVQILQKEVDQLDSEKVGNISVPPYEAVVKTTSERPTIRKKDFEIMAGLLSQFMEKGVGNADAKVERIRGYLTEMKNNLDNTGNGEWISAEQRQEYAGSLGQVLEHEDDIRTFFIDEVARLGQLQFQAAAASPADAEIAEAAKNYEDEDKFNFDDDLYVEAMKAILQKYSQEDNITAKLLEAGGKVIGEEFATKFNS